MIVHAKELFRPFFDKNKIPKNFVIGDKTYFCPTKDMLMNEIYPKYRNWLTTLKLFKWSHKWDCENFADAFKVFASGYYQQTIESEADGISIGVAFYIDPSDGPHAINIIYLNNENQIEIIFLEPQNGNPIFFSDKKLSSIFFIYV